MKTKDILLVVSVCLSFVLMVGGWIYAAVTLSLLGLQIILGGMVILLGCSIVCIVRVIRESKVKL